MGSENKEFESLSDKEVAERFVKSKGTDREAGRESMSRAIIKTERDPEEWLPKPLKGRDGDVITANGEIVTVENYLNDVAIKHPIAIRAMIRFLNTPSNAPDFPEQRQAIVETLDART